MYVCMYALYKVETIGKDVCVYVCMYICMYVCMYALDKVEAIVTRVCVHDYVYMRACLHACTLAPNPTPKNPHIPKHTYVYTYIHTGDAYMVVGGAPNALPPPEGARRVARYVCVCMRMPCVYVCIHVHLCACVYAK